MRLRHSGRALRPFLRAATGTHAASRAQVRATSIILAFGATAAGLMAHAAPGEAENPPKRVHEHSATSLGGSSGVRPISASSQGLASRPGAAGGRMTYLSGIPREKSGREPPDLRESHEKFGVHGVAACAHGQRRGGVSKRGRGGVGAVMGARRAVCEPNTNVAGLQASNDTYVGDRACMCPLKLGKFGTCSMCVCACFRIFAQVQGENRGPAGCCRVHQCERVQGAPVGIPGAVEGGGISWDMAGG